MEGRRLGDRDAILTDLVGVAGLVSFLAGLALLQGSDNLGFDPGAALDGVLGQLAVTVPAGILIVGAAALDLAAGLVLVRLLRRRPFDGLADAIVAAFAGAVVKDTFLLGTLAAVGAFRSPILIAIDVAIVAAAFWLAPVAALARPIALVRWSGIPGSVGSWSITVLVAVVWAGPVILQLASPVVPFVDVLPNYVAPIEHLRTFGWFSPLSATQSPIYGPSRTVFGFDGLLGALATMTNMSGGLAVAAFILPLTVVVAAAAHRLAAALQRDGSVQVASWALLAFALTQPFARLTDARGTVVVVPLVFLGLAVAAEALRRGPDRAGTTPADAEVSWRFGRGPIIGLALGTATMVHPVIGFFASVTVGIAALVRPRELAADGFVAGITAGLIAVPQLATMIGMSLPTFVLGGAVAAATAAALLLGRLIDGSPRAAALIVRLAELARVVVVVAVPGGFVAALAIGPLVMDRLPQALGDGMTLILESSGLLLVVVAVTAAVGSLGARSLIVLSGLAVGVGALLLTGVLPDNLGVLGDALRFELPKTVHYWLSAIAASGAAAGLAFAWRSDRLPVVIRGGLAAAFVVIAALPLRPEPIDAYHLGEHRYAETFAIDLRFAGSGFWVGYPDARRVVDGPRQELLDALRGEITTGRLTHDTRVLHLASTFQQWSATPLGVFLGVDETSVSLEPEHSQHTAGGRLFGFEDLAGFLASGSYDYVVLEPDGLPDGLIGQVRAAGYASMFANQQGQIFRKGT